MLRSIALRALLPLALLAACSDDKMAAPARPASTNAAVPTTSAAAPAASARQPGSTGAAPAQAAGAELTVATFQFKPSPLKVAVGTVVHVRNSDNTTHTVTSGTPDAPTGAFDVKLAGKGATGSFTLDKPGTYTFFCRIHNSMTGQIVVS